jgi:hypothetical protein
MTWEAALIEYLGSIMGAFVLGYAATAAIRIFKQASEKVT